MSKIFQHLPSNPNATYIDSVTKEPTINASISGSTSSVSLTDETGTPISAANPLDVSLSAQSVDVEVTSNSIAGGTYIGKASGHNGDFVTAYTAATQITISSLPAGITAFYAEDIEVIRQFNSSGAVIGKYTRDDAAISVAGNVITVTGATFGATDTFIVYTNVAKATSSASSGIPVTHYSPVHGSVAYTSNVTLTATGFPFTVDDTNCIVAAVYYKPTGSTWRDPIVNGAKGASITASSNVITVSGAGTPFAAGDTYVVLIAESKIGDDIVSDAVKVLVQNGMNTQYVSATPLVDTTNAAAATNTYDIPMDGFKDICISSVISGGVTVTYQASIDGTNFLDVTPSGYELVTNLDGYTSFIDTNHLIDFSDLNVVTFRVTVVTSDASNSIKIYYKQKF